MADKIHSVVKEQADKGFPRSMNKQNRVVPDGNELDTSGGWCLTQGSDAANNTIVYNNINVVAPQFHSVAAKRMVTELVKFIEDERIASVNKHFGAGVGLAGNVLVCRVFSCLHLQTWRVVWATCRRHVFVHVAYLATLHVG